MPNCTARQTKVKDLRRATRLVRGVLLVVRLDEQIVGGEHTQPMLELLPFAHARSRPRQSEL